MNDKKRIFPIEECERLYREGLSTGKIARILGYGQPTIYKKLKAHGVVLRTHHDLRVADISFNGKCQHYTEWAKDLGIAPVTLYNRLFLDKMSVEEALTGNQSSRVTLDFSYFSRIDSPEKAYWLGFIFADGNIYRDAKNHWIVSITLKNSDLDHIQRFKDHIGDKRPVYIYPSGGACHIAIYSELMATDLINLGCVQRKSLVVNYPAINKEFDRHFIRGYFDGNGSVFHRKTQPICKFTSGSKSMIVSILDILSHNDIDPVSIEKGKGYWWNIRYIKKASVTQLYHFFYDDTTLFLPRKKDIFFDGLQRMGK